MNTQLTPPEKRTGYCIRAYLLFSYAFMWFVLREHPDWLIPSGDGWRHDDMDGTEKAMFWLFSPITMPFTFGFKGIIDGIRWLSEVLF